MTPARTALWLAFGLLLAVLAWLAVEYEQAEARVLASGTYCWRTGPRADIPLISEDGVKWRNP